MLADLLPWLNVLLVPITGYVMSIERRLTRLEAFREAEREARAAGFLQPERT